MTNKVGNREYLPALSPNIVTFSGDPPKAAIFR